ncbi:MAG: hypothetical protein K0R82_1282 [Flavipsychrobacter sp.]|jgi:hypothetical protein|nr:hypothetical protein [Flavipsychrobacter sp.]
MEQLEKLLMERAGLTHEQAVKSIETIKEFIQSQLPPMMQGMVDNFIGGSSANDSADYTEPKGN